MISFCPGSEVGILDISISVVGDLKLRPTSNKYNGTQSSREFQRTFSRLSVLRESCSIAIVSNCAVCNVLELGLSERVASYNVQALHEFFSY